MHKAQGTLLLPLLVIVLPISVFVLCVSFTPLIFHPQRMATEELAALDIQKYKIHEVTPEKQKCMMCAGKFDIRDVFHKTKWKFSMEFSMKGKRGVSSSIKVFFLQFFLLKTI